MGNSITIEIPQAQAKALLTLAKRLTFDDCLRRTDGGNNIDQAYVFIEALGSLRKALEIG